MNFANLIPAILGILGLPPSVGGRQGVPSDEERAALKATVLPTVSSTTLTPTFRIHPQPQPAQTPNQQMAAVALFSVRLPSSFRLKPQNSTRSNRASPPTKQPTPQPFKRRRRNRRSERQDSDTFSSPRNRPGKGAGSAPPPLRPSISR